MEQEYKISINITPKAFEGLARQGMLCHQGICELCDDALAAALPGEKARVCVALALRDGTFRPYQCLTAWEFSAKQ